MVNPKDLRVVKTKRDLSQSFFLLLKEKNFSDISVKSICNSALIHRTTFYQHFLDKYDLLYYLLDSLTQDYFLIDIKKRINQPFTSIMETINNITELKIIKERQDNDKEFERTTRNHFVQILQNDILNNQKRIVLPSGVPIELAFYIYGSVLFGFMEWIENHKISESAENIDKLFYKSVNIYVPDN